MRKHIIFSIISTVAILLAISYFILIRAPSPPWNLKKGLVERLD